jgi:CNT family concentrative nucleoside transporter
VASTTLGVYVAFLIGSFPQIAGHLISASIISIPAVVVMTKLLVPETETPETFTSIPPEDPETRSRNLMSAIIAGAMDGLKLAAGITALLIAMLGLVSLLDRILALPSRWLGLAEPLSLVKILGWILYPLAALLGIVRADIAEASRLLGERVILTEVISYQDMAHMVRCADSRTWLRSRSSSEEQPRSPLRGETIWRRSGFAHCWPRRWLH